jgi:hypothetical protein
MIILVACLAFAGCLSLALGESRNWNAVAGAVSGNHTRAAIRTVGWILLGAALAVAIAVEAPGFAVLLWTLLVAVASFVVAMMLSFYPRLFRPVARACSALWP